MTKPGQARGVGSRIVNASLAVGGAHLIFKLLGLAAAIAIGQAIDNHTFDIVYVLAFEGIILSIFFIGEEIIGPCFLPVFTEEMRERGEDAAWRFANTVLTLQGLLLIGVIAAVAAWPEPVINWVTDWDETDADRRAMAVDAVRTLAPALLCLSVGSTTYLILNGYKQFFLAALGDAASKLVILLSVLIGIGVMGLDYRALLWGVLAGSLAKLLPHAIGLGARLRRMRPLCELRNPALRKFLLLALPLILGILCAKYRDLYSNVTALSGLTDDGLMKANSFGRKLFMAISWLVPYAVSIAMFPFLCELANQRDHDRLAEIVTASGRMILSVFIPAALVLAALSEPMSMALFHGGAFDADTVRLAALSNACYLFILPAFSLEYILMQGFFANRKMTAVIVLGIVFSIITIGLTAAAVHGLELQGAAALAAVALAYAVTRTGKVLTLSLLMRRFAPVFPIRETLFFLLRTLLAGLVAGAAAWLVAQAMIDLEENTGRIRNILICMIGAAASAVVGLPAAHLLRVDEPLTMIRWTLDKLRRRNRPTPTSETP